VTGRSRPRLLFALALVASLITASVLVWPMTMRHAGAAAVAQVLQVNPPSGPAGTQTDLTGFNFPRQADLSDNLVSFTFDATTPMPPPVIVPCGNFGFGFGSACDPTSPYSFAIPMDAQPGQHTFHLVIRSNNPAVQSTVLVDVSATFTVVASDTETPTLTATDTPTASPTPSSTGTTSPTATVTATATDTSTPVPNAPTATSTNTPLPNVPTATSTNTATATATPQKVKAPFVVLVRTEFNHDLVAIALHTAPAAKIHLEFKIMDKRGAGAHTVLSLKQDGVTNARGILSFRVKVHFPTRKSGWSTLAISETSGGTTQSVRRAYRYRVS
jgi:hypothetical protein